MGLRLPNHLKQKNNLKQTTKFLPVKAHTIQHNGKTFYAVHAQWPARYLKSWALLDNESLKTNSTTLYFRTKAALIQHVENNF